MEENNVRQNPAFPAKALWKLGTEVKFLKAGKASARML